MQNLPDYLISNFWQIAGGIAAACFGAWLFYRAAYRGRFAAACATFRAAFNDELAALESKGGMTTDTRDLLLSVHLKHSAAIAEFRRHLFWRRRSFDRRWQQHHHGHGFDAKAFKIPEQDRLYLVYLAITEAEERTAKSLAITNIHALLRFAKET